MISNYTVEIELSLLNYCLFHGEEIKQIAKRLKPQDFSYHLYGQIFREFKLLAKAENLQEGCLIELGQALEKKELPQLFNLVTSKIINGSIPYRIRTRSDLEQCINTIQKNGKKQKILEQALTLAHLLENPLTTDEELNEAIERLKPLESETTEEERLKLEIGNYLLEQDPFKRVKLKNKIHCNYRINRHDFLYLVRSLQSAQRKPKKDFLTSEEFFALDFSVNQYLVPGLIPLGESILFAGDAKCGKSNLVGDLVRAVLEGKPFLGEKTKKAKILYGACDESLRDTQNRFLEIGIDLIPDFQENLALLRSIEIDNLQPLIDRIEKFKPQLVIIDNLTTIARNAGVAEKDPEFAHYLYELNDIAQRNQCTFIILHHQNKDPLAKGMKKIGGTNRLLAAPSEIWQIFRVDENNYQDPRRRLSIVSRSGNSRELAIQFNSPSLWSRQGIFKFNHEIGDENGDKRTQGEKILDILKTGDYEGLELKELTGLSKSLYPVLDRLIRRGEIKKRRSSINPRSWVYYLDDSQQRGGNSQSKKYSTNCTDLDPPSPSPISSYSPLKSAVSIDNKDVESSKHQANTFEIRANKSGDVNTVLDGVLASRNNCGNSVSGFELTNGKKKGGEGVSNSTNIPTNDIDSQLAFLEHQLQIGDKVKGKNAEMVISNWIGYVLDIKGNNIVVQWENRKELMTVQAENLIKVID